MKTLIPLCLPFLLLSDVLGETPVGSIVIKNSTGRVLSIEAVSLVDEKGRRSPIRLNWHLRINQVAALMDTSHQPIQASLFAFRPNRTKGPLFIQITKLTEGQLFLEVTPELLADFVGQNRIAAADQRAYQKLWRDMDSKYRQTMLDISRTYSRIGEIP